MLISNRSTILLVLLLSTAAIEGYELLVSPPSQQLLTQRSGNNLLVICNVDQDSDSSENFTEVVWLKDGDKAIDGIGRVKAISKVEKLVAQLMFVEAEVEDSGVYKCILKSKDTVLDEKSVQINFVQAVQFVDAKPEQHPENGVDAEIVCRVSPEVEIFWQFNGRSVSEGGPRGYELRNSSQVLFIPNFEADQDDGIYVCSAAQFHYLETLRINVTAYSRPIIPVLQGPPNDQGYESHSVDLICQAVGKPKPVYKWSRKTEALEEEIKQSEKYLLDDGLLRINSLLPTDEGIYTCTASNAFAAASKSLQLNVFHKPKIESLSNVTRTRGESVELSCQATGHGNIKIKWVHQGQEYTAEKSGSSEIEDINQNDSDAEERYNIRRKENTLFFTIDAVREEDAGKFQCVAENEAGRDHREIYLSINHEPVITDFQSVIRVQDGGAAVLYCEASAVPEPEWEWKGPQGVIDPDGVKFKVDSHRSRSNLVIADFDKEDYGNYSCTASNGIGEPDSRFIKVVRIVKPLPPTIHCLKNLYPNYAICEEKQDQKFDEGQQPTYLTFSYSKDTGNSDWLSEAVNLTMNYDTSSYKIPNLEPESRYLVRVSAGNEAGSSAYGDEGSIETTQAHNPEPPLDVKVNCNETCTLTWKQPNDQGSPINKYRVVAREVDGEDNKMVLEEAEAMILELPGDITEADLSKLNLKSASEYEVKVIAVNALGDSVPRVAYLKTSENIGDADNMASLGSTTIAVVIGLILLFLLLVIDLICYATNRCGIISCFCSNCLGQNVHSEVDKDAEQGNRSETNRLLGEPKSEAKILNSERHAFGDKFHSTAV